MADNKVQTLFDYLLDELIDQFKDGVKKVDDEGNVVKLSVDSRIMTVASKIVKDFAEKLDDRAADEAKAQKLEKFLSTRRDAKRPSTGLLPQDGVYAPTVTN